MLGLAVQLKMSEFCGIYDRIVPAEHFLRRVRNEIDFSFVNPMMRIAYCEAFGRPAYEPEMMFKGIFLQKLYDLSDREYILRAQTDMAFKYFLGLNPEDAVPDASLLSKFRKTRLSEDMLEELLAQTVRQAVEKGIIKSNAIIVDSTHTRSRHAAERPTQILREMTKELRKELYKTQSEFQKDFPEKPLLEDGLDEEIAYSHKLVRAVEGGVTESESIKAKKLLEKVKRTLSIPDLENVQSIYDTDAKVGHKAADKKFFGYKTHIAVTENEGIITAISVTDGNISDGKMLDGLIGKTLKNGVTPDEVIADTAYSGSKNIRAASEKGAKLIAKVNPGVDDYNAAKRGEYVFFNKDADTYERRRGYLAAPTKGSKDKYGQPRIKYAWKKKQCQNCPYKKKCLGSQPLKNAEHEYKKFFWSRVRDKDYLEQRIFQETEYFKSRYKERYRIEQKNADLKNNHGLRTTCSQGLLAMKAQSYFTVFAANVKKIVRLTAQN
jgi:IS5 family transposase